MTDKIEANIIEYGPLFIIVLISSVLWFINRNISIIFLFNTFFLYAAIYCIVLIVKANRRNNDIPVGSVIFLAIYLFLVFVPSVNFYVDLFDYSKGNYSTIEGVVTDVKTPRGYRRVYISDTYIDFWDWSKSYKDYPNGKAKINYLPKSKQGLSFEVLK